MSRQSRRKRQRSAGQSDPAPRSDSKGPKDGGGRPGGTPRDAERAGGTDRRRELLTVGAVVLAAGIYSLVIQFMSTRNIVSFHGLAHAAHVYQIFNGIVPPTNPLVAGHEASTHWIWHWFIAQLMHVFGRSPCEVISIVNAARCMI